MKYQVQIMECLSRIVVVEAQDKDSAIKRVRLAYDNEEIVLSGEDIADSQIAIMEDEVPDDFTVDYVVDSDKI